jgi:general secretion pathway protein G
MGKRVGFTLVELVVVVMILGILAAVAAPKLFSTSGAAMDNSLKQTLSVVRGAIDLYAADHQGTYPAADGSETTFVTDLTPYIRGGIPKCPVGAKNAGVKVITTAGTMTGDASPTKGWQFNNKDGGFIVNSNAISNDGATTYDTL